MKNRSWTTVIADPSWASDRTCDRVRGWTDLDSAKQSLLHGH